MKKTAATISMAGLVLSFVMFTAAPASAASVTLSPWVYNPDNLCPGIASTINPDGSLTLSKPCPTPTNAAPGAALDGVSSMSTTGMTLSFDVTGYCGAGAPRFNVYLSDGSTVFLGCVYGNDGSGNVSFTAGSTYGGVLFPEGATVTGIDIVQDEEGTTTLSNIMVNDVTATPPAAKDNKELCKKGGWMTMSDANGNSFKNQGACVSYFAKQQN